MLRVTITFPCLILDIKALKGYSFSVYRALNFGNQQGKIYMDYVCLYIYIRIYLHYQKGREKHKENKIPITEKGLQTLGSYVNYRLRTPT